VRAKKSHGRARRLVAVVAVVLIGSLLVVWRTVPARGGGRHGPGRNAMARAFGGQPGRAGRLDGTAGTAGDELEASLTPDPAPAKDPVPAKDPAAGTPLPFGLGLNEALAVPQRSLHEGRFDADSLAKALHDDGVPTQDLGAHYVRGNSGAFPRSSWWASQHDDGASDDTDVWMRTVQDFGFEPILIVSPWPANRTANYTEHYLPDDMPAYLAWVQRFVERYDGDGVDDMPGLTRPIRYWEVDNEPDLKFTLPPMDAVRDVPPGSFCTPAEEAQLLIATSKAIRTAFPAAKVLNGGIYRPFADTGQSYLKALVAIPGVTDAFDILSLHSYAADERGDKFAYGIRAARQIVGDKPTWITETSVTSAGDKPFMDEDWQARMVAMSVGRAAAEGASLLLWHTLADAPPGGKHFGMTNHSLLSASRDGTITPKPSAAVYRNLSARLAADDILGASYDGDGAVRLESGAVLLYEGGRAAKNGGIDLRTGDAVKKGGTAAAPAWLWP
jgi:hypothetical protein